MKSGESKKLMKAMGAKSFDPMPPDQHKWQAAKGEPPIHRIWSWLCAHTIHWNGQERSPFAIDKEGNELYLEHLAKDLWGPGEVNLANAKQHWHDCKARGVCRNGTKEEGRRRLYLCGEVIPAKPDQSADPEKSMYILIPDQILKKTKDWPPEKQEKFRVWWNGWAPTQKLVSDTAQAEVVAAARSILDRGYDSALAEWGLPPNRQEHTNGKSPEEIEARQKRLDSLLPTIEKYVHTVAESVQTQKTTTYNGAVQTQSASATLLPSENTREEREPQQSGSSKSGSQSSSGPVSQGGKKPIKQLPVPPASEPAPKLTEPEAEAFAKLRSWQKDYKQCDFGEDVSIHDKGQLTTVRKILAVVKQDVGFFEWAETEKIPKLRAPFGKLPGHSRQGGRFLGLVEEWAGDYMRGAPARREQEKREAFAKAAKQTAEIEAWRAIAADPNESDEVREISRRRLKERGVSEEEATHG